MFEKISCVMVTKRLNDIKTIRSIESFINQSYCNKELIIVSSHQSKTDINKIYNIINDRIQFLLYKIPNEMPLGTARNISIKLSSGEYICQWDDDDISHKDRLLFQYNWNTKNNVDASLFSAQYHIFENETPNKIYLENRPKRKNLLDCGWPGTIMAKKRVIEDIYPNIKINEDYEGLQKISNLKIINYENDLYHFIYSYHGCNTWDLNHNMYMVNNNRGSIINKEEIKNWLNGFNLSNNYILL
jgi:glycosyltransferase involved in cell wall biosynthesis